MEIDVELNYMMYGRESTIGMSATIARPFTALTFSQVPRF